MKIAIIAGRGNFPIQIANENPEPIINMEKKKDPPITADARASEL